MPSVSIEYCLGAGVLISLYRYLCARKWSVYHLRGTNDDLVAIDTSHVNQIILGLQCKGNPKSPAYLEPLELWRIAASPHPHTGQQQC